MLVEFTVGNYRSFGEPVTWSMEPEPRLRERDDAVNRANLLTGAHGDLLRVAAVYGANASGKSNLIRALGSLRQLVMSSSARQAGDGLGIEPFALDPASARSPSELEIVGIEGGRQFRYRLVATGAEVRSEELWVRAVDSADEVLAFAREGDDYRHGPAWAPDPAVEARTRADALHLSVAAQFNHPVATQVLAWFRRLDVVNGLSPLGTERTGRWLRDPRASDAVLQLIRRADFGVTGVQSREPDFAQFDGLPEELQAALARQVGPSLEFEHRMAGGELVRLDEADESAGTQRLARFAGPVLDALRAGGVLVVDEIEARLHTLLTLEIVRMFQDPSTNPAGAQLLFATHDTNLLTRGVLRRDQLWFVEKDRRTQASTLFSLAEVAMPDGNKVRNDRDYESDYLQGRYGAIPFFGSLRAQVGDVLEAIRQADPAPRRESS